VVEKSAESLNCIVVKRATMGLTDMNEIWNWNSRLSVELKAENGSKS
jgi:hypothetical protein